MENILQKIFQIIINKANPVENVSPQMLSGKPTYKLSHLSFPELIMIREAATAICPGFGYVERYNSQTHGYEIIISSEQADGIGQYNYFKKSVVQGMIKAHGLNRGYYTDLCKNKATVYGFIANRFTELEDYAVIDIYSSKYKKYISFDNGNFSFYGAFEINEDESVQYVSSGSISDDMDELFMIIDTMRLPLLIKQSQLDTYLNDQAFQFIADTEWNERMLNDMKEESLAAIISMLSYKQDDPMNVFLSKVAQTVSNLMDINYVNTLPPEIKTIVEQTTQEGVLDKHLLDIDFNKAEIIVPTTEHSL